LNNNIFLRFTKGFTLYILVLAAIAAYPLYKFANPVVITGCIANMILFYIITVVVMALVFWAGKKQGTIVMAFLAGTVIKILFAMIYLLIFLRYYPGHEMQFTLTFFAAYLICTGFEIYWILSNLRQI
jgi:hypothetical protein